MVAQLDNEFHAVSVVFNGEIWYKAYLESFVCARTLH
jgi:hypothetical protein